MERGCVMENKKKIAILSCFQDFNAGYSLINIVRDQITMLEKYGHEVTLFVSEVCSKEDFDGFKNIKKLVPFAHLKDYRSMHDLTEDHKIVSQLTCAMLIRELKDMDIVFSHDWVFTGWNYPYAKGIMDASPKLPKIKWMHWIHSIPSPMYDWWDINLYGKHHKIIFPNSVERVKVAEQFRGVMEDVRTIPHIKDLRTWWDFSEDTIKFIDRYPAIMQGDCVQIYPASVDRLESKRVREVILILSKMKKLGRKVCLVICNQWATGTQQKQDVNRYHQIARRNGLTADEFIFTSDFCAEYEVGISKRMVRELMQCSNLFIFPTREESFGLVVPEAALAGVTMMLNKSLNMMFEVGGHSCLYGRFGSFDDTFKIDNESNYFTGIAQIIIGRMNQDEAITAKTFMKLRYNYDSLYNRFYAPIMAESELWDNTPPQQIEIPATLSMKKPNTPSLIVQDDKGNKKIIEFQKGKAN